MSDSLSALFSNPVLLVVGTVAIVLILCSFITIWVVINARHETSQAKDREETRREIAAYVAEGSMTAEDASRLLTAGGSIGHRIMNELGDLKRSGEARRPAPGPAANGSLKPQTT